MAKRSTLSARDELARETEEYHSHSRVTDRQAQTSHRNANLRGKHYAEGQDEVRTSRAAANRGSHARTRGGKSPVSGASTGMFSHGGSDYQFAGVPGAHGSASSVSGHASRSFSMPRLFGVPVPLVILAIVLVVAVAFGASQLVGKFVAGGGTSSDDPLAVSEDGTPEYTPSVSSLDALTDPGESVATVSLLADQGAAASTLSDESKQNIETAISAITDNDYNVGCVLLDLQSGNAIAYNVDTSVFGASSFKGPYCVYLSQNKLESGSTSLSSIDGQVENVIKWSDNNSYNALRRNGSDSDLASWLEGLGVDGDIAYDTWYPHYTPRYSLRLWMNSYLYLFGGDSTAEYTDWLKGLFSSTEVSFLRDGISSVSKANDEAFDFDVAVSGDISDNATSTQRLMNKATQAATKTLRTDAKALAEEVTVYDKAGWIATADYSSDTDAGIIQEGDKYYLMTIMTGQPDSDGNREKVSNLASALWAAHSQLSEVTMAESDQ